MAVVSRVGGMETVVVHAADAAEPCSVAHELRWGCAPLKCQERPQEAMRSVGLDSGTLDTPYLRERVMPRPFGAYPSPYGFTNTQ